MLKYHDFLPLVGRDLAAQTETGSVPLTLRECAATGPAGDIDSFSLIFTATPDQPLEQGSYLVSGDGFGPEPIFLVPIGPGPGGLDYQAVFNRRSD